MHKLKYKYKFIWLIASKWKGYHSVLQKEFPEIKNGFSEKYKNRILSSAIRGASLMYVLSKSAGTEYNDLNALNTGLLSALFDDLIDNEQEDFATISNLITQPEKTKLKHHNTVIARDLYIRLLKELNPWQKVQLSDILLQLLDVEKIVKLNQNGEWKKRGTFAFYVYLTIINVKLSDVNQNDAIKYGEYLQLLDDYEDYSEDEHHINYFRLHPEFDLTEHYINEVKPNLGKIFNFEYDKEFLIDFVETYHVFQTMSFKYKYESEGSLTKARRSIINLAIRSLNGNRSF